MIEKLIELKRKECRTLLARYEAAGKSFIDYLETDYFKAKPYLSERYSLLAHFMAMGTVWANYASNRQTYLAYAIDFISGAPVNHDIVAENATGRGQENLQNTLLAYRRV